MVRGARGTEHRGHGWQGGQLPGRRRISVSDGAGESRAAPGAVTIMFKEYGVRLNFIPTITPRGTIRLQVAPEVSALDFRNAVQISGFNVPAITTRKVKTEVELGDGADLCDWRTDRQPRNGDIREDSLHWRHSDSGQVLPVEGNEQNQHGADGAGDAGDRGAARGRRSAARM